MSIKKAFEEPKKTRHGPFTIGGVGELFPETILDGIQQRVERNISIISPVLTALLFLRISNWKRSKGQRILQRRSSLPQGLLSACAADRRVVSDTRRDSLDKLQRRIYVTYLCDVKVKTLTSSERDEIKKANFVAHRGDIFHDVGLFSRTVYDGFKTNYLWNSIDDQEDNRSNRRPSL